MFAYRYLSNFRYRDNINYSAFYYKIDYSQYKQHKSIFLLPTPYSLPQNNLVVYLYELRCQKKLENNHKLILAKLRISNHSCSDKGSVIN